MKAMVKISQKNTKMGKVPSISLAPIVTCREDAPCKKDCYAMKAYRMYKATKNAYDHNTFLYKDNPKEFEESLVSQLKNDGLFRFHVAGDIIDDSYFSMMVRVANAKPNVKFLAFTKKYEIINEYTGDIPSNLSIVFSGWKGLVFTNPKQLPTAWFKDPKDLDERIPERAIICSGKCDECKVCWNLKNNESVVFEKH